VIAGELLLRVGIRSVQNLRLAVCNPHRGCRRGRLQPVRTGQYARLLQRLGVGAISRYALFAFCRRHIWPAALVRVDHQQVLHVEVSIFGSWRAPCAAMTVTREVARFRQAVEKSTPFRGSVTSRLEVYGIESAVSSNRLPARSG